MRLRWRTLLLGLVALTGTEASKAQILSSIPFPDSPDGNIVQSASISRASKRIDYVAVPGGYRLERSIYDLTLIGNNEMRMESVQTDGNGHVTSIAISYYRCDGVRLTHLIDAKWYSHSSGSALEIFAHDRDKSFDPSEEDSGQSRVIESLIKQGDETWCPIFINREKPYTPKQDKSKTSFIKEYGGFYHKTPWKGGVTYNSPDGKTSIDRFNGASKASIWITRRYDDLTIRGTNLADFQLNSVPILSNFILSELEGTAVRELAEAYPRSKRVIRANWPISNLVESRSVFADRLSDLQQRAEGGDAQASMALFRLYRDGDLNNGFKPDMDTALAWAEKAASAGDAFAQNELGAYYSQGFLRNSAKQMVSGSEGKSPGMARFWLEKAASQGFLPAQKNLVTMQENADEDRASAAAEVARQQQKQDALRRALRVMIQQQQIQARRDEADRNRAPRPSSNQSTSSELCDDGLPKGAPRDLPPNVVYACHSTK